MNVLELLSMSAKDVGYQLTAYEKYGSVGIDELKEFVLDEVKNEEIDVYEYDNWLYESEYGGGDYVIYDNDEDFFNTYFSTPLEAVRASFYGDYNYNDNYVRFNGYGNLDSSNYADDLMDLKEEYWEAYIEENIDWEDEEIQEVLNICNDLVKQGY